MSDSNTFRVTCPYCGQTNEYYTWDRRDDGLIHCSNCGSLIDTSRQPTSTPPPTWSTSETPSSSYSSGYAPAPTRAPPPKSSNGNQWYLCCAIGSFLFVYWPIGIPLSICFGIAWYKSKESSGPSRPKAPQTW